MVTIRPYSVEAFEQYLREWKDAGAVLKCSFLHHTWSPAADDYRGTSTVEAIRDYHTSHGWSDIACHAYTAPDGQVFNARPPISNNCACQYPAKPASQWPPDLRRISGEDPSWVNGYGFGCETIGNFDEEDPAQSVAMRTSLDVLAAVHRTWNIPVEHCFFHRDVANKSCPGDRVTKDWVHAELAKRLDGVTPPAGLRVTIDGDVLPCDVALVDGQARCDLRPVVEALGAEIDTENWPEIRLTKGS